MHAVQLEQYYRGHAIRLQRQGGWSAELVELRTGALLPTKVTASEREGLVVAALRAHELVDLYVEAARTQPVEPARRGD